jgi:MFS family permease
MKTAQARLMDTPILSAWSPLRKSLFRWLWIASIVSNLGTWMQNVGGSWLMTSLSSSALLVALMQAATSLPVFLVGIAAGAIADIVDRRKLLLVTQTWMLVAAALLGLSTFLKLTTPWVLLSLTFLLGLGAAMNGPVWQAMIPELVGREELSSAVALNGVGYNIARAIGPALGGIVVASMGAASVFILNALSFLAVIVVVKRWDRPSRSNPLPAERFVGAIRAGFRYVRHTPLLHFIFIRTSTFILFGSALWALLPVVAVHSLSMGAEGYGLLLGCLGTGSLIGALLLPYFSRRFSLDAQTLLAALNFSIATFALGTFHNLWVLCMSMVIAGIGWLQFMSSMNVATQSISPNWVQARALGFYLLVVQGTLAVGSAIWGILATRIGVNSTLLVAGFGFLASLPFALKFSLHGVKKADIRPAPAWPEPELSVLPDPDDGPVLVTVEYRVAPKHLAQFTHAMHRRKNIRLRDGATRWELYQDLGSENRYLEQFVIESWAEHLRQHSRSTRADFELETQIGELLLEKNISKVSHLVYVHENFL